MLHHVEIHVSDIARSAEFYDSMLGPLGWRRHDDDGGRIGWGLTRSVMVITAGGTPAPEFGTISFPAKSIPAVKAAFQAAGGHGGEQVIPPSGANSGGGGVYKAIVKDPDGHRVELIVAQV